MSIILKMCFAVFLAVFVSNQIVSVESANIMKRETQEPTEIQTEKPIKICDVTLSCGWAVYTAFTREILYFMKNSCECPEGQHCVRVDDDPVISAFVYKCRNKRTTTVPPTTETE